MNAARIASLLRELADAFEQVEPKRKRIKKVRPPEVEPTQEARDRALRALRKVGAV